MLPLSIGRFQFNVSRILFAFGKVARYPKVQGTPLPSTKPLSGQFLGDMLENRNRETAFGTLAPPTKCSKLSDFSLVPNRLDTSKKKWCGVARLTSVPLPTIASESLYPVGGGEVIEQPLYNEAVFPHVLVVT